MARISRDGPAPTDARRPHLLRADNVTPPARTPWGGRRIAELYKRDLGLSLGAAGGAVVGESWEVSVEPSFPSRVDDGRPLADLIAADPVAWLGEAVSQRYGGQTPLLVKLLDAADDLSLQVHPAMDDPALGPDESGKPEGWIITDTSPGAGIYLGFREGVDRDDVAACIQRAGRLDELMNFVPVSAGDVFILGAGTPHAVGRGCTLVEPQHVAPGRRGLTYRYWDWNRRYDAAGRRDPEGAPRELHLERALEVTRWDAPRGAAFVATCRATPKLIAKHQAATRVELLRCDYYVAERWTGEGEFALHPETMLALTVLSGQVYVRARDGVCQARRGQSVVIPAAAADLVVTLSGSADVTACRTIAAAPLTGRGAGATEDS